MSVAWGLSRVSGPMLAVLEAALEQGRLDCPVTLPDLGDLGFRAYAEDVARALQGLDRNGTLAAVRVVLAERAHRPPPRIDLVWTGPETKASTAQNTALCVERLFDEAERTVIVGGYTFDRAEILAPLHRAMKERGVSVMIFMDIEGEAQTHEGADAFATAQIDRFFQDVWNFGLPKPDVYYDPRTAAPGPPWASLHAKCVVVDDKKSFITSANFTDRGQSRNIEVGVLIDDVHLSEQVAGQWRQLVGEGLVRRYAG